MMYKKSVILLSGLILAGCQTGSDTNKNKEWVTEDGCERYFSETAYDLAACRAYVESMKETPAEQQAEASQLAVKTTPEGAYISRTQGIKEFESSEENITE